MKGPGNKVDRGQTRRAKLAVYTGGIGQAQTREHATINKSESKEYIGP